MSTQPIRVLLADDHAVVRKGICEFLTEPGDIEVIAEASNGDEAIALLENEKPDVAVLDIQMPKRSGIDVCRHVRAQHWPIGLLILTAYDDDPYVLAVLQAGANGYVLKTADADDIIQAVRDVHEGKSALDPVIARKLMAQLAGQAENKPIESLTPRELDVLQLAARGYTNKAIGAQLHLSNRTVQGHLANIYDKLHVATRTEAVMRAVSLGWLTVNRVMSRLRGLLPGVLIVVVLPLTLALIAIALGATTLHQNALRDLIAQRDERTVREAANNLAERVRHQAQLTQAVNELVRAGVPQAEAQQRLGAATDTLDLPVFAADLRAASDLHVALLDKTGQTMFHGDSAHLNLDPAILAAEVSGSARGASGTVFVTAPDRMEWVVAYAPVPQTEWPCSSPSRGRMSPILR
jgi:DNA-binding NarL/FixJ family response regulator